MREKRVRLLEREIDRHDKKYWEEQNPEISDPEYDKLIQELQKLDPTNTRITKVHPSVQSNKKVKHKVPMLSLDKVYTVEDLLKWCEKVARSKEEEFLIQIKYDGCSANYEGGTLATRGDGLLGEDITDKLSIINVHSDRNLVRGEIVFSKLMFDKYKDQIVKKDGTKYSNPRNACAGLLNRDDNPIAKPILDLIPFEKGGFTLSLNELQKFDFHNYVNEVQTMAYPADGLVIKLADEEYKKSLGYTSHHNRGEIALKFANDTGETKLIGVEWSTGKESITPVGLVEPVQIGGVTIKRVSLHNMEFIKEKDIRINDRIVLERAGDVIPHVVSREEGEDRVQITLGFCPACRGIVAYQEPNLVCVNPTCVGKLINKLYDSVRRIGIDRLGKPTLENMIKVLNIKSIVDIFKLTKNDILSLPGFAERKAEFLLKQIYRVKKEGVFEKSLISSLNIPGIGDELAKTISDKFSVYDLLSICGRADALEIFSSIDGFSMERASELKKGLLNNREYIRLFLKIIPLKYKPTTTDLFPSMKTICLTGKFPENKSFYYKKLKDKGYTILERVTDDLDLLVVADMRMRSGKQKSAEKKGIKMIDHNELMDLIGD